MEISGCSQHGVERAGQVRMYSLQKREKAENHCPSIHPENSDENKPKQRSKDKSKHDKIQKKLYDKKNQN